MAVATADKILPEFEPDKPPGTLDPQVARRA